MRRRATSTSYYSLLSPKAGLTPPLRSLLLGILINYIHEYFCVNYYWYFCYYFVIVIISITTADTPTLNIATQPHWIHGGSAGGPGETESTQPGYADS